MAKLVFIQTGIGFLLAIVGIAFANLSEKRDSLKYYTIATAMTGMSCGLGVAVILLDVFLQGGIK
ncbi:hypothetical protein FP435_04750 [Lactobacillus sp. PV037]|uniref:hypothetical protein n=1 Tax=Lactobacillus sp. PV037 TaxID=2594496 RepID=UPI00223EE827|nr:hypothetical protein [Lactobacillus sp. PV037]QNQ83800.1 hypothetical protein FP435_04750 [Lactobacillus sp. PV037]